MRGRSVGMVVAAVLVLLACGVSTVGSKTATAGRPFPSPSGPGGLPGVDFGNRVTPAPNFPLTAYQGLGAWLDVFDWSDAYRPEGHGGPVVGVGDIDAMAGHGVTTLFIQTARYDNAADLLEPARLRSLVDRAHDRGMAVVAWYLPTFMDPVQDFRRLLAPVTLGVDGIAVDIESRLNPDVAERTRRLVELSARLRNSLGSAASLGAIVLPITVIEDVNPNYWPGYPWAELAASYDVFLPMNYWTNRLSSSPWRDAYASTAENISRIRLRTGRLGLAVHPIGGSAARVTAGEVEGMRQASIEHGAIGGSLYDYVTTPSDVWGALSSFRV